MGHDLLSLLNGLWPDLSKIDSDAQITIWEMPGKESYHYSIHQIMKCVDTDIEELVTQFEGHDVYFGLGLRRPGLDSRTRGGKKDVNYLPGWALDIDMLSPGAHAAENLPASNEDVDKLMTDAPDPTAIVHTGNGLHVYWAFKEPMRLTCKAERDAAAKAYEAFQEPFIARAESLGWQLDKTSSIDRVWRLPGFKNMKKRGV